MIIVVGVDGSAGAAAATSWTARLAARLGVAVEEEADMLVVGTRGAGARPPGMLGSTSLRLAEACPVPLVVVPAALPVTDRTPGGP